MATKTRSEVAERIAELHRQDWPRFSLDRIGGELDPGSAGRALLSAAETPRERPDHQPLPEALRARRMPRVRPRTLLVGDHSWGRRLRVRLARPHLPLHRARRPACPVPFRDAALGAPLRGAFPMSGQPSLFDGGAPLPRPPHLHREDFLAGMLATWMLGEKKPNRMQREALDKIARRTVRDAELVVSANA